MCFNSVKSLTQIAKSFAHDLLIGAFTVAGCSRDYYVIHILLLPLPTLCDALIPLLRRMFLVKQFFSTSGLQWLHVGYLQFIVKRNSVSLLIHLIIIYYEDCLFAYVAFTMLIFDACTLLSTVSDCCSYLFVCLLIVCVYVCKHTCVYELDQQQQSEY